MRKQKHKCKAGEEIELSPVNNVHPVPNVAESSLKSAYQQRLLEKISEVQDKVEAQAARIMSGMGHEIISSRTTTRSSKKRKTNKRTQTRMNSEFPRYALLFQDIRTPHLITTDEYMSTNFEDQTLQTLQDRYSVVVATLDEARRVMARKDPLQRPIVVPGAYGCRLTMDAFLADLSSRTSVDVQEQDVDLRLTNGQPRPFSGRDAVSMLKSGDRYLNLLNLECIVDNATPPPLENHRDYTLLTRVTDDYTAGKKAVVSSRDLTNCASFQICATAGCWSEMHHDSYGKVTTIHGEVGEKAWLTWPRFRGDEMRAWIHAPNAGYAYHPDLRPMMLHLQAGDLLIMPSNTPHAPYTITDCLMTGTQHFHSASVHIHLQAANLERQYPNLTNEDGAHEAATKFRLIGQLMAHPDVGYTWPSTEDVELYGRELKVTPQA